MLKIKDVLAQIMPPAKVPLTIGYFDSPEHLVEAAEHAMDNGFKDVDAITPYPIHGLAEVLKISDSMIPWATLGAGLSGAALMLWVQWYTSAVDYPLNVGGKPLFSWPAFAPITFEGGELIGGVTTFVMLLITAYMARPHAVIKNKLDPKLTDNRFALLIPNFSHGDDVKAMEFLKGQGADEIRQLPV
ncbi:MAG: DUF3341 domain-containing protein [bacterium]|nr:DUF3341 domain-containing protein [bacterium]